MKKFLGFLLFIALIALAIWAFFHFKGFGGFGKDSEKGKSNDTSVSATTEATTVEDKQLEIIDITVSGNDYLYNNEKMSLDKLITEISKFDKNAEITINTDDTAAKNTVDELTDKLEELGYNNFKKADK